MEEISTSITSTISEDCVIARDEAVDVHDVFQCNICMDRPTNSVLTSCGHLFCWSCLYRWLQNQPKPCPVCKIIVKTSSITPVYGSQRPSSASRVDDSIPPRPSAPATEATQPSRSDDIANASIGSSFTESLREVVRVHTSWLQGAFERRGHTESLLRDLRLDALRSRAQADFREIRASHPPSSIGWIAEASHEFAREFDPSRESGRGGPMEDLHLFVFEVLVPQGEYVPGVEDFLRSWFPFYVARNAELSWDENYTDFLEGWARHFHAAWIRAGRPGTSANATEAPVESLQSSATSSSEAGPSAAASHERNSSGSEFEEAGAATSHDRSTSGSESEVEEIDTSHDRSTSGGESEIEEIDTSHDRSTSGSESEVEEIDTSHDRSTSGSESEVEEIDAMEHQRVLQQSGQFNRRIGRESRRADSRFRPY